MVISFNLKTMIKIPAVASVTSSNISEVHNAVQKAAEFKAVIEKYFSSFTASSNTMVRSSQ